MVGRTQARAVSEDDNGSAVSEPTIPELVNSLKSAFQKAAFTRVQEALLSREEKLRKEIERKNEENKLLQEKLHIEALEKLKLQKECEELKTLGKNTDAEEEIVELKKKNCELRCAKLKAEKEVEICNGRMKVLEEKMSILEKDLDMLNRFGENGEAVNLPPNSNAGTNPSGSSSHSERTGYLAGKNKASQEVKSTLETKTFGSNGKPLSETNQNPGGSSSHGKRPDNRRPLPEQVVEISDSDDEAAPSERQDIRGTVTEGQMDQSDSGKTVAENDPAMRKRALDVDDNCPMENNKRVKIQEHAPFTSRIDHSSKKYTSLELEKLLNESSSSSSSDDDDDLDLTVDYSAFIRTDDSAYQTRDQGSYNSTTPQ